MKTYDDSKNQFCNSNTKVKYTSEYIKCLRWASKLGISVL